MEAFLATDYPQPENFLKLTALLFLIVFIRYLVVSGLYHYVFFILFRKKLGQRIINASPRQKKQLKEPEVNCTKIGIIIVNYNANLNKS